MAPASRPDVLARELAALGPRHAGSEAERLAALRVAAELRATGRRVAVEPLWVRPHADLVRTVCATLGIAGSIVAVDAPRTGLVLALAGLLLLVADLAGLPLLRRLTRERATQVVVAGARAGRPVTLLVTAALDAPRRGVLAGIPGAVRLAAAGLFGVCALAALRAAEVEGDWLGPVQLVPTALLILAVGAFLDAAGAPADEAPGAATGPAAVLEVVRALDELPLRRLAVEVVVGGAGALGIREHVRRLRAAGVRPEEVCVLHLGDAVRGPARVWTREGLLLPLAYHPLLVAAGRAAGGRPTATATTSGARVARARGWPAIRVGTRAQGGEPDPRALAGVVDLAVDLVRRLDADLAAAAGPDPTERPARRPRRAARRLLDR